MSYELAAAHRRVGLPKRRVVDEGLEESRGLLAGGDDESYDDVEVVQLDYPYKLKAVAILLVCVALAAVAYAKNIAPTRQIEPDLSPANDSAPLQPMQDGPAPGKIRPLSRKQLQIANYINGTALLFSVHITHHAGTSICSMMKKLGPAPVFACMGRGKIDGIDQEWPEDLPKKLKSWPYNDTATYTEKFRALFHFVSQEYGSFGNLHQTNWEYENLVSMIVMRHPLERFLSGGKCGPFHENRKTPQSLNGDPTNATAALYWEYANDKCADNYALRVLANNSHCANGTDTSLACLESAKALLNRFTFILDQACLSDSMVELGRRLHLNITEKDFENHLHHKHPPTVRERLGNDTLYEYLQERFRRDISLYEWSKTQSIVQCKNIQSEADPAKDNDSARMQQPQPGPAPAKHIAPVEKPEPVLNALSRKQLQVANYINGSALILNVHITHHAGTSVCAIMKKLGPTPVFACMGRGKIDGIDQEWPEDLPKKLNSWPYNDTATLTEKFRALFHFVSQEYGSFGNLHRTNWEHENLVSMIVMRDPIERFLAGGKCTKLVTGDPTNETQAAYWVYANDKCADNYALRVLANNSHCANGTDTSLACLESAKDLLRRFTFILDQACLSDSMVELGSQLHLNITEKDFENHLHHKHPPTVRERLGNDTLYEYLQERFRRDISLYEWSKTQSIVQCDKIIHYR